MTSTEYLIQMISSRKGGKFKTYSELAEKAGVSQGNLSNFLTGKKQTITFESVWKIFNYLQIPFPSLDSAEQHSESHCPELETEVARLQAENKRLELALARAGGQVDLLKEQLADAAGRQAETPAERKAAG